MQETHENRLKRLKMRSWRRGTKEMDIVLGPFADTQLAGLSGSELDLYDALLWENDQDLMSWITGQAPTPAQYLELLTRIAAHSQNR